MADELPWYLPYMPEALPRMPDPGTAIKGGFYQQPTGPAPQTMGYRDPNQAGPAPPTSGGYAPNPGSEREITDRAQVYPEGDSQPNEMYAIEGRRGKSKTRGGKMRPRRQAPMFVDQVDEGRAVLIGPDGNVLRVPAMQGWRESYMTDGSRPPDRGTAALRKRLGAGDPGGPIDLTKPVKRRVVP